MANVLMIIGGILAVIGLFGLFSVAFEPVRHSFVILFKREQLDHYHGDDDLLVREREKSAKILSKMFTFFLVVGLILLGIGCGIKYIPHGEDSLFSKDVEGNSVGDGDIMSENEEVSDQNNTQDYSDSNSLDTKNTDNRVYIVIRGSEITFGDKEFSDLEEFKAYFKEFNPVGIQVCLVDYYASSKTYKEVRDTLNSLGMPYEEMVE